MKMKRTCVALAIALALGACSKAAEADGASAAVTEKPADATTDATADNATPAATPAAASPRNFALNCVAPFTQDATAATLAAAFGKENVIPETIDGPEGEKLNVTAIYPNDPAKRIEVYFKDEEARTGLVWATVKSDKSIWSGPGGVRIGEGIETVEAANGGVFHVSGFDWDYGGYVNDWKSGKLMETAPGCRTVLRFRRAADNRDRSIIGEGGRASNLPALRAAKPTVSEFGIRW
jgi:hypothetical protein